ncbi:Kinase-like protein [Mycena venus]|uniref:Kinase-like protein n=1 Tax=Mycena venus TaxID=2733690 RepID=A0A8H6Z2L9_9AGAR|nr:Kinase-like protein [Mycena venus]
MLESYEHDHLERELRAKYPQCEDCGTAARNLRGARCGRCEKIYKRSIGEEDDTLVIAERQRGLEFQARMNAGKQRKKDQLTAASAWRNPTPLAPMSWKDINSGVPSHTMTTENLVNLRQSRNGTLGRMLTVSITAMIGGTSSGWLPCHSDYYHCDTKMEDIIEEYLQVLNAVWEDGSPCSLRREDVDLRWHMNRNLIPGTMDGTVAQLFDIHHADPSADMFFRNVPEKWSHLRGERMCFELYIDVDQFEARELTSAPPQARGKRERPEDLSEANGKMGEFKRLPNAGYEHFHLETYLSTHRHTVDPSSRFEEVPNGRALQKPQNHGSPAAPKPLATEVSLYIASVNVDIGTGQVEVSWGTEDIREALLDNTPFAKGKTKKVYRLLLDGKPYVAKRFFELENEFIRLHQGQWFLDQFYARADETETEVSNNFMFSRSLLVRETIEGTGPSPASGVSMQAFLDSMDRNPDTAIVWLLEPSRGSAIERWSGTLQHPNHENKPGQTIDAFMHFSYVYSRQTLVFADIQGSKGVSRGGNSGWILFDIMTHTSEGASGVGDHGQDGIQAILSDHICNRMCRTLNIGEENIVEGQKARVKKRRVLPKRT